VIEMNAIKATKIMNGTLQNQRPRNRLLVWTRRAQVSHYHHRNAFKSSPE